MANIGAKIGIEGERQFNQELKNITQQGKTLAAEMDKVTSAFNNADKSEKDMSSVTKKLNEQIDNQRKLVDKLKEAVQKSSEKTGENSTETLKWKEKLAKAEKGLGDLEAKAKDAASGVDNLGNEEKETSEQTSIFGDVLKANLASEVIKKGIEMTVEAVKEVAKYFVEAVKGAAEYADEILTLEKTTGMSTDALQEYKYMAELLDVDLSTITSSMTKMEKAMASDSKAFEELGVATRDENGNLRDANDVFDDAIHALKKIENPVERDTKAMEIFGKSAKELNPLIETSSEDLAALRKEAHDVGAVMDSNTLNALGDVQDGFDRLGKAWESLKRSLGAKISIAILPDLENFVKLFQDFVNTGDVSGLVSGILSALQNLVKKLKNDMPRIAKELGSALGTILANLPELIKAGFELGAALLKGLLQVLPSIGESIMDALRKANLSQSALDAIAAYEELKKKLDEIPTSAERIASSLGDIAGKQKEAEHWIAIFDELNNKTKPTAEETAKLQTAVDKLNELYPELGLKIDDETGKWNMNTEMIKRNIKAMSARYQAEAYYSAAGDTLKQIALLESESRELRNNVTAQKNRIENLKAVTKSMEDSRDGIEKLMHEYGALKISSEQYYAGLARYGLQTDREARDRVAELTNGINANRNELYSLTTAYDASSAALGEYDSALARLQGDVEWFFKQGSDWEKKAEAMASQIPAGVVKGINKGGNAVNNAAGALIQNAIDRMKNVAQIQSPSKVTENLIGKNLALGVIKGWDDIMNSPKMRSSFSLNGAIGAMRPTNNTTNLGGVSIVVNGAQGQDANAIANLVMKKMQGAVDARRAVFA